MAKQRRGRWGGGQLYKPKGSRIWRVRYYDANGKRVSESLQTENRANAQSRLHKRMLQVGRQLDPAGQDPCLSELLDLVVRDYERNGKATLSHISHRRKHLERILGAKTSSRRIRAAQVENYISSRQSGPNPASNATVNRELAVLRRGFRLAMKLELLSDMPTFTLLREDNVRRGFVKPVVLEAIIARLPAHLRAPVRFASLTAWRMKSEVLPLKWAQVDLQDGWVRLEPGTTKSRKGRTIKLTASMRLVLVGQHRKAEDLYRRTGLMPEFVFFREARQGAAGVGDQIRSMRADWSRATREAGAPDVLIHDLRRTGVMNLVKANVPRSTAKKISGHETDSIFERYNIEDAAAMEDAKNRLEAYDGTQERRGPPPADLDAVALLRNVPFTELTEWEMNLLENLPENQYRRLMEEEEG